MVKSSEVKQIIGVSPGKLLTIRNTGLLTFTKTGGNIYHDHDEFVLLFFHTGPGETGLIEVAIPFKLKSSRLGLDKLQII